MSEQVVTLQDQLSEKEQLVAALTDRLEQAAEQLDRHKRTGADRTIRSGGGFPAQLIEDHSNLVDELQHAVEQWEDMQVAASLGRVEIQISELRDLITGQLADGNFAVAAQQHQESPSGLSQETHSDSSDSNLSSDVVEKDEETGWESLKAGILAENLEPSTESDHLNNELEQAESTNHAVDSDQPVSHFTDVTAPVAIDFSTSNSEQLQQAIDDRDTYIAHLLKQLRISQLVIKSPTDWESLNNTPDELCQRIQELEQQLDDTLRVAEVELSLERARLGREAVKLQQLEEQVQKNMKLLGLDPENGDSSQIDNNSGGSNQNSGGKRWRSMLGLGNSD